MNRLQTVLAKTALLAAAFGLSACVGVAPEPVYYYAPGYYSYQPQYYAPRPAPSSFVFFYQSNSRSNDHRGHGGHRR